MDLQFLLDAPKGDFSVAIRSREGTILHQIDDLPRDLLLERLPRLVDRAAVCKDGHLEFTFEGPSSAAIISMLRFAVHGDYTMCEQLHDGVDSVLLHLQLFALSHWFRADDLAVEASRNFKRLMWTAACEPCPLNDLIAAVRFLYTVLDRTPDTDGMREDMAHYVLGQWEYHHLDRYLGLDAAMKQCPRFMQDLSTANVKSDFQLAGAGVVCQRNLEDCRNRDHVRTHGLCDFLCEYHEEHDGVFHYFAEQRRYWEEPTFSVPTQFTLPVHNWPTCPTTEVPRQHHHHTDDGADDDDGDATPSLLSDSSPSLTEPVCYTPVPSTWDGRATSVPLSAAFSSGDSTTSREDPYGLTEAFRDGDDTDHPVDLHRIDEVSDTGTDGSYDFVEMRPRGGRTPDIYSVGSATDDDAGDGDDDDDSATISDASSDFTMV